MVKVNVAPVSARETACVAVGAARGVGDTAAIGAEVTPRAKVGNWTVVAAGNAVGEAVAGGGSVTVDNGCTAVRPGARAVPLATVEAAPGAQVNRPKPTTMHTSPTKIATGANH